MITIYTYIHSFPNLKAFWKVSMTGILVPFEVPLLMEISIWSGDVEFRLRAYRVLGSFSAGFKV